MNWQPIDTAPTDGSEFLAYDPVAKKFDVCVMHESVVGLGWVCHATQSDGEYGPYEDEFHGHRATLWASLADVGLPS